MSLKKSLFLAVILISSVTLSAVLIWQGLNLDNPEEKPQVLGNQINETNVSSSSAEIKNAFLVEKVVDGDTFHIKINGQTVSVRMIGIDTPETVDPRRPVGCFGKKASDETKRLIEGKQVILVKDISETDKYNRLLRYVYLPIGDGQNLFINDYLVRQGFANASSYPPDVKYDQRFKDAEREARENVRGLWGECK